MMRYCARCLIPETHETITFDREGVCSICRQIEQKQAVDWDSKRLALDELVGQYVGAGARYDAIVPMSGGKDSSFTLYYLRTHYPSLRCLSVTFDHGWMRPTVQANLHRTLAQLGVDHLSYRPSHATVQQLMRESFQRKGDFCWHCHAGVFAYPMWVALEYGVHLVVWGEPSAEYTTYYSYTQAEEVDERRFNRLTNLGITARDMRGFVPGLTDRDLWPFQYPPADKLRALGCRSVCLGSYIPWDVQSQAKAIMRHLDWRPDQVEGVPPEYSYEKIECWLQGTRDYARWLKRGYGRTAHLASIDIRNGRLDRAVGEARVAEYDGQRPHSLPLVLEELGMGEEEFEQVVGGHAVTPWAPRDWGQRETGEQVWDEGEWAY